MSISHKKANKYLQNFLDNKISPKADLLLKEHLETCDQCKSIYDLQKTLVASNPWKNEGHSPVRISQTIEIVQKNQRSFLMFSKLSKSVNFLSIAIITVALVAIVSLSINNLLPSPANEQAATETVEIPALPPLDGTALLFEDGKYKRDEYCTRVFSYQETTYGQLTIGIADNFLEPQDSQELALKVIDRYIDLQTNSPAPMDQTLIVLVIPDPNIGECISRDNIVFVEPEVLDSKAFNEALLGAGTGIGEYWVKAGLTSLIQGEKPDTEALKNWYQNTNDLDMVGLFYARFHEDWTTEEERGIARMSATSLVQYALEIENIQPDKLVEQVNNDIRTGWLESLGVKRMVNYPYDGRFVGFIYSNSNNCKLIVEADGMLFCLNRLPEQESFDEIWEVEYLIEHTYYGRKMLVDYFRSELPSINDLMNPNEMRDVQIPIGHTHGDEKSLQNSTVYYYVLHEIAHSFNWNLLIALDEVWQTEGFSNYLLQILPIYQQARKQCVYEDLSGRLHDPDSSIGPGTSYCYFLDTEQFDAARDWYLAQGGETENEDSVNLRLYTDAVAFATLYNHAVDGTLGVPIGELYNALRPDLNLEGQKGLELNITQANSFVAWLSDTYTINRVLDVYVNDAEDGMLDKKTYDELKADWYDYLISNGPGIEIPYMP